LRIEPIHDTVDKHPLVPVVQVQDDFQALAELKLLLLDVHNAADAPAEVPFRLVTAFKRVVDVGTAVQVGRRVLDHALRAEAYRQGFSRRQTFASRNDLTPSVPARPPAASRRATL
jgi:hypothetical protein